MTTKAPTLSAHLLQEAEKFCPYPNKSRRSHGWIAFQRRFDDLVREQVKWRKTFTPSTKTQLVDALDFLLDELYCRDLLKQVPQFVDRTRRLRSLTLEGVPDRDSLAYLIEAANCYISGTTLAAVALARAAMELSLKRRAAAIVGEQQAA